jgi:hypothetical protein
VIEPRERPDVFELFASGSLPRRVKRETRQQNLITLPKGLNPRTSIYVDSVQVFRLARPMVLLDSHFCDVDPDTVEYGLARFIS